MAEIHDQFDTILILDFGSQYSHLITRRCRELNVYAELMPCTTKLIDIKFKPKGIILSGSPYSVYDDDAPHADPGIYDLGVPILGICYGLQELCWNHKGQVAKCDHREYGFAEVEISRFGESGNTVDALFEGLGDQMQVWMSHGDQLSVMPPDFHVIGRTNTAPYVAIAHNTKPFYGIQFHPEVTHSPQGRQLIGRFVLNICQCQTNWTMEEFIGKEIVRIREICGPKGRVIGAVSGGVDSTVAAKLMHEAIGDRCAPFPITTHLT
ncbi:GMP synthase [Rhizopogon vinicolor AM-OR11-026]|uniref:GMP synthase n=1 Tax=Rhizopogon vinicolor AM-OR11-026 TaxID=1314800 RepID=A0A1B7MQ76_9AGAM|nr:GMP synthase [Rhizopogon vinicolor AM-OR11-026]